MKIAKTLQIMQEDKFPLELASWIATEYNEKEAWEIIHYIRETSNFKDYTSGVKLKDHEQLLKLIEMLRIYGYINMPNKMYLEMLYGEEKESIEI